jgi:YD repeat-containing protein
MADPISFDPFLGWVDITDPNNIPQDARVISATDLLRYENFGVAAKDRLNELSTVATDGGLADLIQSPGSEVATALSTTYAREFEPSTSIVYDPSTGAVTSSTEGGITTTYTYNADGTVDTETRLGKVRTWAYDASGNPTSSTVV